MARQDCSFDSFLKKVVARDSHPIYFSFLSTYRLLKILFVDSIITGSIFGICCILSETKIKSVFSSWNSLIAWVGVLVTTSLLKSMKL